MYGAKSVSYENVILIYKEHSIPVTDQGFPRGGGANPRGAPT